MGYLQKTSEKENSVFRVKKAGWYRINYFGAGERHYNYAGIWLNGNHIHHGHDYASNWADQHADLTWKMKVGDKFWVQIHGGGHGYWNYHSWSKTGDYSRLQITYVGDVE